MKKVQTKSVAELVVDPEILKASVNYFDSGNIERRQLAANVTNYLVRIENYERDIRSRQEVIVTLKNDVAALEEKLAAFPESNVTPEGVLEQLTKVSTLPWVERVHLERPEVLVVRARKDALTTTFFQKLAYFAGQRTEEFLEEPLVLPLPQYEIRIVIGNADVNRTENAMIRLVNEGDYSLGIPEGTGWIKDPSAHWATNRSAHEFAPLCLGNYEEDLVSAAKTGVLELLNMIVIFLQESGWSGAYKSKLNWATWLGNPTYTAHLLHEVHSQEELFKITAERREQQKTLPEKWGIPLSMLIYGSSDDENPNDEDEPGRDDGVDDDYEEDF